MWHFCNNHDQWRMQAIDDVRGVELMKSCLGWLTFWTGVPLHYAGDEQAFKTYGTALDGWAREELSLSLAWRAIGTLPMRDAFDMAAPMYVYIQRLNRLRDAYLSPVIDCEAPPAPASSRMSATSSPRSSRKAEPRRPARSAARVEACLQTGWWKLLTMLDIRRRRHQRRASRSEPVQRRTISNCSRRRTRRWTQFSRCSRRLEIWT